MLSTRQYPLSVQTVSIQDLAVLCVACHHFGHTFLKILNNILFCQIPTLGYQILIKILGGY